MFSKYIYQIFLFLFPFSLIIDTFNGLFIQTNIPLLSQMGQVYRIMSIGLFSLYILKEKTNKRYLLFFMAFSFISPFLNYFEHANLSGLVMDVSYILKLYFPIIATLFVHESLIRNEISKTQIFDMLRFYMILAPLTLLLPVVFGVSFNSYELGGGYKGFYVSNNEINIVLVGCYLFSIYEYCKFKNGRNLVLFLLNLVALLLIGSKTSIIVIGVSLIWFFLNISNKLKIVFLATGGFVSAFAALFASDFFVELFNRMYFYYDMLVNNNGSIIDFLMSARNLRVIPIITQVFVKASDGIRNIFLGIGRYQQVDPTVLETLIEIDFFDSLVWYGIVITLFVTVFYLYCLLKGLKNHKSLTVFMMIYIVILLFSQTAGHVWFSPLSTTFLSLITTLLIFEESNNATDKVSIVVPVYNVEQYIGKCLDSLINQTYKNIEILVIDDGSKDNSYAVCKEYAEKDERIVLIQKENGGLSSARNAGIDKATGQYITFLDSDDYLDLNYIETAINFIDKENLDVAVLPFIFEYPNKKKITYYSIFDRVFTPSNSVKEIMLANKFDTNACSKIYRIDLFENLRFPEGQLYEDLRSIYKVLDSSSKVGLTTKSCYYYVQREGSIMHTFNNRVFEQVDAINDIIEHYSKLEMKKCTYYANVRKKMIGVDILFNWFKSKNKDNVDNDKISMLISNLRLSLILNVEVSLRIRVKNAILYCLNKLKKLR